MPPPLFLVFIPGLALVLVIQMVICREATHILNNQKRIRDKSRLVKTTHRSVKNLFEPPDNHESSSKETSEFYTSSGDSEMTDAHSTLSRHQEVGDVLSVKDKNSGRRKTIVAESYDPTKNEIELSTTTLHDKTIEEINWLTQTVKTLLLFRNLAWDQIDTVVRAMYKYPVSPGDIICEEGDEGSTFFIVQEGMFDVLKNVDGDVKLVRRYENVGCFGELALLYNQPRAASVVARTRGLLWALDGHNFRHIICQIAYQKRQVYERLVNHVPLLESLNTHEQANLADALVPVTFNHGEVIFKQGDEVDGMYFVLSGQVTIVMYAQGRYHMLKEVGSGDYFGELALVTDQRRAASAFADGLTNLAYLDRADFERLMGPCVDLMKRNIELYADKLQDDLKQTDNQKAENDGSK